MPEFRLIAYVPRAGKRRRPRPAHRESSKAAVVAIAIAIAASLAAPYASAQDRGAAPRPTLEAGSPPRLGDSPPSVFRPRQTDGWSRREAPATAAGTPPARPAETGLPLGRSSISVERTELAPVMAGDGSSLPLELWAGLDVATIERLFAGLTIPPRSAALHEMWRRLVTASVTPPSGSAAESHFAALRLEALYRSGLLGDIEKAVAAAGPANEPPVAALIAARSEIGLGRREAGCQRARSLGDIRVSIPATLRGEAILVAGYCAAADGNAPAAGLLADLAREEGVAATAGLTALDQIAYGGKPGPARLRKGERLSLVDYRILELAGALPPPPEVIERASPALLAAIVGDTAKNLPLRLEAAETAIRLNAIRPDELADIYRASARAGGAAAPDAADGPARRAALFTAADAERTPFKKVRLIRSALDSARRAGLYLPMLRLTARMIGDIGLAQEIGWFAETAVEASLAAGNYERARAWIKFATSLNDATSGEPGRNLGHWLALIDIADPQFPDPRGTALAAVERLALTGRFSTDALHRLATVLDALEYHVPIPLWEAASRTPQPATGFLPPTGVLTELQQASVKREFGRTVLLAMQSLGPDGADRAHMIALGDSIRALKRAGLEADARKLALEALIGDWPRNLSN